MTGLTEASTNFDLENVKPFLQRLSPHVDGFGPAQIDPLVAEISAMAVDAERSWSFEVVHGGKAAPFHVVVHMDDVDAPDVYFFTTPELAAAIDREMAAFFEELGL